MSQNILKCIEINSQLIHIMVEWISLLMGSTLTALAYQTNRVVARTLPYLTPSSVSPNFNNNWVVVAGSTDGIGKQYLKYLSSHNCRVIALGRNTSKLQNLKSLYNQTELIKVDFETQSYSDASLKSIEQTIKQVVNGSSDEHGSKIVGFVNCVGQAHFSRYLSLDNQTINKIHNTNIGSLHFMLKLSNMLTSDPNLTDQTPFFINISSAVASNPSKYSAIYSASKAYHSNLMQVYRRECQKMTFLDVRPWYVKTKMVMYQNSWDSVLPEAVVEGSFRVLGKVPDCSGTVKHELIDQFSWVMRDYFDNRIEQMMAKAQKIASLRNRKK